MNDRMGMVAARRDVAGVGSQCRAALGALQFGCIRIPDIDFGKLRSDASAKSIHGAQSCFQRADEDLREVRRLLSPARHGGKKRTSGTGMDRRRHAFGEIQRNLLALRYDRC